MIIFDLICAQDHQFEGWFQSPDDYDSQLVQERIVCPCCGSANVRRIPSAIHLAKPLNEHPTLARTPHIQAQPGGLTAYRQLMAAMLSNSEDVGNRFAEEARDIYYQMAPERSIRGEASAADCEALREEGIEVLRLPVFKNEDLN